MMLQILSSTLMDAVYLSTTVYWVLYTRNTRFFFALFCFYLIRLLHIQLIQFRFPSGYYWEDSGVPAITNSYGRFNDFVFSVYIYLYLA